MIATDDYTSTYNDFTEASYRELLEIAKLQYQFSTFTHPPSAKHVLWRHDVDFSMHRALRLAELENEAGVKATYFLYPHSMFYNLMSRSIVELVHKIAALGHDIGLHFDPTFYEGLYDTPFETNIAMEKKFIIDFIKIEPIAISFHLFGVLEKSPPKDDLLCGMINAYGTAIFNHYGYVSDSNGIWRFRRLRDVLEKAEEDKLQVLTHPELWSPIALSPRKRIQRCIDGYAAAMGLDYDTILANSGRPNIG